MAGKRGKMMSTKMKEFIVISVEDDGERTNAVIKKLMDDEFGYSPDISTISRYRSHKGLIPSHTAKADAARSVQLTQGQRDHVLRLMDKFHLPLPDGLRLTDMISAVGEGKIGAKNEKIYIRRVDKKLVECWLTEVEVKSLTGALSKMPGLQAKFSSVHEQGIRIIDDILGYNTRIELGTGDISFDELKYRLEVKKPERLDPLERNTFELRNRYISFGKTMANFKRKFEKSQVIYPGKVQG
ncbi:hypothetical protein JYU04_00035 [Dehalococcoides mccartyi]|nr:hypothetical protein [Dehalococcoides mccartyi]